MNLAYDNLYKKKFSTPSGSSRFLPRAIFDKAIVSKTFENFADNSGKFIVFQKSTLNDYLSPA